MKNSISIFLLTIIAACAISAVAQDNNTENAQVQQPSTLFPYPQVPDTIATLESRSNFFISHFWDNCNLSKPIQDTVGYESAFRDWVRFFKFAHRNVVFSSLRTYINKIQSNDKNVPLITQIAEKSLYLPGAELWSDEVYMPFVQNVVKSKRISNDEKARYAQQLTKLNNCQLGSELPNLEFTTTSGKKMQLSQIDTTGVQVILVYFNIKEAMIQRLRLSTDIGINRMIKNGTLKFVCLDMFKYSNDWAKEAADYADNWIIGTTPAWLDMIDVRVAPSFYLIDKNRVILNKNVSPETVQDSFNNY